MARKISPFKLGLFILTCGTLSLVAVIWLGASHYFEKTKTYAAYFDESVKGLQKDATVNYRGVGVGRVAGIGLAPDGRLIEILMRLRPDFHIDPSLAIQLRAQGLTGLSYLEIDTAPENIEELTPKISFPVQYPVISSYPSELQQLKSALTDIYNKVTALDLKGLTTNWTQTAELVNSLLVRVQSAVEPEEWKATVGAIKKTAQESAELMGNLSSAAPRKDLQKSFKDLSATIEAARTATENLSRQMNGLPANSLADIAKDLDKTVKAGGTLFTGADRKLGESMALFQQDLQQLRTLLTQMNALVQTLKEQPNRVIFPSNEPDPFKRK